MPQGVTKTESGETLICGYMNSKGASRLYVYTPDGKETRIQPETTIHGPGTGPVTIRTGLYQDEFEKHGIEAYTPTPSTQKLVMSEIYNYIKGGYFANAEMWGVIETEIREMGCDGAILACTELSVVKKELKLDDYYLDPMEVMADRCIEIFRGKGEIK